MEKYKKSETAPSEAGETLMRISGIFPNYNSEMIVAEHAFALVHKTIAEGTDEATGKSISSSKAEVVADASPEAFEFKKARGHVVSIEAQIGALKFLQRSLETEYINSNT